MRSILQFLQGVSVLVGLSLKAQSQAGSGATRGGMGVSTSVPNSVTDPGFASRLGHNVGLQAVPPVTMPPGVGNINHPGLIVLGVMIFTNQFTRLSGYFFVSEPFCVIRRLSKRRRERRVS